MIFEWEWGTFGRKVVSIAEVFAYEGVCCESSTSIIMYSCDISIHKLNTQNVVSNDFRNGLCRNLNKLQTYQTVIEPQFRDQLTTMSVDVKMLFTRTERLTTSLSFCNHNIRYNNMQQCIQN